MDTPRLTCRIPRDFPDPGSAHGIHVMLDRFCQEAFNGNPDQGTSGAGNERIRAAIVLLGQGDVHRCQEVVTLGLTDWGDLLVAVGLAHADSTAVLDAELGPE